MRRPWCPVMRLVRARVLAEAHDSQGARGDVGVGLRGGGHTVQQIRQQNVLAPCQSSASVVPDVHPTPIQHSHNDGVQSYLARHGDGGHVARAPAVLGRGAHGARGGAQDVTALPTSVCM